jgi:hypothetical protein
VSRNVFEMSPVVHLREPSAVSRHVTHSCCHGPPQCASRYCTDISRSSASSIYILCSLLFPKRKTNDVSSKVEVLKVCTEYIIHEKGCTYTCTCIYLRKCIYLCIYQCMALFRTVSRPVAYGGIPVQMFKCFYLHVCKWLRMLKHIVNVSALFCSSRRRKQ